MHLLKRIDSYILRLFIELFLATFFISTFIFFMQALWRYVDFFVGKGVDTSILLKFFSYAAIAVIPLALPLAILLASLMIFGNLGEKFELTAFKATGTSLFRIMLSLIIFVSIISVGAFFFSNDILPKTQKQLTILVSSLKKASPELEIPTGEFYTGIEGYNLYVRDKDTDRKLLKDIMIYDFSKGFNNASVTSADSARLKMSADKLYLILTLYNGESFENIKKTANASNKSIPYRRETFREKEVIIDFDANFRLDTEAGEQRNKHQTRNIKELSLIMDTLQSRNDSTIKSTSQNFLRTHFFDRNAINNHPFKTASKDEINKANTHPLALKFTPEQKKQAAEYAYNQAFFTQSEIESNQNYFRTILIEEARNRIEWHRKFTLSFACLIFFFIGAPLGAIIRKGGLGISITISVLMFIFYYIIDQFGYKFAREDIWPVWQGIWLSSICLLPIGLYFTYKAATDSPIFSLTKIRKLFKKKK